jgi:hypothetical protein
MPNRDVSKEMKLKHRTTAAVLHTSTVSKQVRQFESEIKGLQREEIRKMTRGSRSQLAQGPWRSAASD